MNAIDIGSRRPPDVRQQQADNEYINYYNKLNQSFDNYMES